MLASDTIPWNPSVLDDEYSTTATMLPNDQDNNPKTGIEWSFNIWEDIPDYEGDPDEDTIVFSLPDVKTTIPIVSTAKTLDTTNSDTNGEFNLDFYPDGKFSKNNDDLQCKFAYSFELPVQDHGTTYDMVIPEEPPVLLPPPEPPPLTIVSLTSITTKWGDSYQEWRKCNSTYC